jgi:hypothetical protein
MTISWSWRVWADVAFTVHRSPFAVRRSAFVFRNRGPEILSLSWQGQQKEAPIVAAERQPTDPTP